MRIIKRVLIGLTALLAVVYVLSPEHELPPPGYAPGDSK